MNKIEKAKKMLLEGSSLQFVQFSIGLSKKDISDKCGMIYNKKEKCWIDLETGEVGVKSNQWNNKEFFLK